METNNENEPFRATQLWNALITNLETGVTRKRKKYKRKHYDDCFTGEDAVDVIYDCLHQERRTGTLITNEITRLTAIKVCQTLMDNKVIEMVGVNKKTSPHKFNQSSFHRFVGEEKKSKCESTQESAKPDDVPQPTVNTGQSTVPLEMSRRSLENLSPFHSPYKLPDVGALEMEIDPGCSPFSKRFVRSNLSKKKPLHATNQKQATSPKSEIMDQKSTKSSSLEFSPLKFEQSAFRRYVREEKGSNHKSIHASAESIEINDINSATTSSNVPRHTVNLVQLVNSTEMPRSWFERMSPFRSLHNLANDDAVEMNPEPRCSPFAKRLPTSNLAKEKPLHATNSQQEQMKAATKPKSETIEKKSLKVPSLEFKENLSYKPPSSSRSRGNFNFENCNEEVAEKTSSGKPSLLKFQKRQLPSKPNLLSREESAVPISEDSIWRQVALSRLLPLLDLPYIEDIVASPKRSRLPRLDYQLIIPNHMLLAMLDLNSKSENQWIQMAHDITESRCFFLDNPIGLTDSELKMQAFDKIHRYYCNLPSPIIPTNLCKVFTAILRHIKDGLFSLAARAYQLAVLLLPWQQRKEFKQLLNFMQMASNDTTVTLQKQFTNRQYMLNEFTPLIIQHELLGHEQGVVLVSFILHILPMVFSPPPDIKQEVELIILDSKLTGTPVPPTAINYCQQVSSSVYKEQAESFSKKVLQELMYDVMDSGSMPLKEKEKWLKKFKKNHYGIYGKPSLV